jgi:hypothetical protein
MRGMRVFLLTLTAMLTIMCFAAAETPQFAPRMEQQANARDVNAADDVHWSVQTSGIDTNLRGVSAAYISDAIAARHSANSPGERHIAVWACGSNGVILLSTDLGKTWKRLHIAGGETLDFRGIVALDEITAYVMSSGEGDKSRVYKTMDGGETWKLEFTDKRALFFLDALVCNRDCYALSDPVDGKFVLVGAQNGENWKELSGDGMPAALPAKARLPRVELHSRWTTTATYFSAPGAQRPRACFTRPILAKPGPQRTRRLPAATRRPGYFQSRS